MEVSRHLLACDQLMMQTPLKSKTTTCANKRADLLRLQLVLMFLISSAHFNSKVILRRIRLGAGNSITDFDNPNLAKVCYRVDNGREISALQRVKRLLLLSTEAQESCYDGLNPTVAFWKYLSLIPDPSCIWDIYHDLGIVLSNIPHLFIALVRGPEEYSDNVNASDLFIFHTQPKSLSSKNGLLPPEIVDRIECFQKVLSKSNESIDLI